MGAVTVIAAFATVSAPFAVVMSKFAVTSSSPFITLQVAISTSLLPASSWLPVYVQTALNPSDRPLTMGSSPSAVSGVPS